MAKKPKKQSNPKKQSSGGKPKKIIIIIAVLIILLGGGGAAAYFTDMLDPVFGHPDVELIKEVPKQELALGPSVYHDLPEFVADLKVTNDSRPPFIKLQLTIQVAEADLPVLTEREPKIIDRIQRLLRDQTRLDLTGAKGTERLRSDIVLIVNQTLAPAEVYNVLFKQFVLQ